MHLFHVSNGFKRCLQFVAVLGCAMSGAACLVSYGISQEAVTPSANSSTQEGGDKATTALFDGKTLDGWQVTQFGGQREVAVVEESIQLNAGDPLTGITWDQKAPSGSFELALEAKKIKGNDFFCAVTFPVNDSHCTLVLGGWGGTVTGLSCLDGRDASENETTQYKKYEFDRWYKIRIRVADGRIRCWLDDESIVDVATEGRKISLRHEVLLSRPLGICSFATQSQLRRIQLTPLTTDE